MSRQTRTQVPARKPPSTLRGEVLRGLLLGLGQGVALSGDGTDGAMRLPLTWTPPIRHLKLAVTLG
jgi:hypothetical protein